MKQALLLLTMLLFGGVVADDTAYDEDGDALAEFNQADLYQFPFYGIDIASHEYYAQYLPGETRFFVTYTSTQGRVVFDEQTQAEVFRPDKATVLLSIGPDMADPTLLPLDTTIGDDPPPVEPEPVYWPPLPHPGDCPSRRRLLMKDSDPPRQQFDLRIFLDPTDIIDNPWQ